MTERNITTKVAFDTTGVESGAAAGQGALKSFGETAATTARKHAESLNQTESAYRRMAGQIDPAEKAQQRYARAVEVTNRLVAAGRITQEQANATLAKASTFYSAQAAQVNSLGDIFDKVGGKTAIVAGNVMAFYASFKAGVQIGNDIRSSIDQVGEALLGQANTTDKLIRTLPAFQQAEIAINAVWGAQNVTLAEQNRQEGVRAKFLEVRSRILQELTAKGAFTGLEVGQHTEEEWTGIGKKIQEAQAHAKQLAERVAGAARETALLAQEAKAVDEGMDPRHAKALFDAAKALGARSLFDPMVKAFAASAESAAKIQERITATVEKAKNAAAAALVGAQGRLEPVIAAPDFGGDIAAVTENLGKLEKELADQRQQAVDELTSGLLTAEQRRNAYLTQAKVLLDAGAISQDTYNHAIAASANAIQEVTTQSLGEQLDNWTGFLDSLAGEFGGFFSYLAQAAHVIQGARSTQADVSGAVRGMGGTENAAAAAGGIAAVVYIFYQVYTAVDAWIKKMKSLRYGNAAEFVIAGGGEGSTRLDQESFKLVNSIREAVRAFEHAFRVSVTDLDKIGIQIRNDGKYVAAWVNGVMIGHFNDVNDAIREALRMALTNGHAQIAGMTALMQQGLTGFTVPDADEFTRFMEALREVSDMGLTEGAAAMQSLAQHTAELFHVLMTMSPTQAVADGVANLMTSFSSGLRDLYNQLTGHKDDPKEAAEMQRVAYNAQRAIMIAQITLLYEEIKARIALYMVQSTMLHGGSGGPGGVDDGGGFGDTRTRNPSKGGGRLDTRNPDEDPKLAALLEILDNLARALQGLPPEIGAGGVHIGRGGGRGGGGQVTGDQRAQAIADAERAYGQRDMGDAARRIDDVKKKWADLSVGLNDHIHVQRKAGESTEDYNKRLAAAAAHSRHNAAELERLNVARQHEIEMIRKEAKEAADRSLADYAGVSNVDQESQRAADLRKQFADAFAAGAIGAKEYADDLARINALEQQHLQVLGRQGLASLLTGIAGFMDDGEAKQQALNDAAQIGYDIQRAQWTEEIEVLHAKHLLTEAEYERVKAMLGNLPDLVPSAKPAKVIREHLAAAADNAGSIRNALRDALADLKKFTDSLLLDQGLTTLSPQEQEAEARRQLAAAVAGARSGDPEAVRRLMEIERQALDVFRSNEASGPLYQQLFAYIVALNRTLTGAPQFAEGGYSDRRQLAWLHANEVVLPLGRGKVLPFIPAGGGGLAGGSGKDAERRHQEMLDALDRGAAATNRQAAASSKVASLLSRNLALRPMGRG